MATSRFSTLFFAASLGLLSSACTSSSGVSLSSDGDGGGNAGGGGGGASTETLDDIDLDDDADGDRIVDLPDTADDLFGNVFDRYTAVETSAGRIHLLAQAGVSNAKVRRARAVLEQHLAPVAGSAQGANKDDVAAAMVANNAIAGLFTNVSAIDLNDADVVAYLAGTVASGVVMPATNIVLEGSAEYMAVLPDEDNTFGVMAALVHRAGLRTARSTYYAELDALAASAITDGDFEPRDGTPDSELTTGYLAVAMDVHSGVFGHDANGDGSASGATGSLLAIDRSDLAASLPATLDWLEDFFATGHNFEAILPESFSGNFDCLRRGSNPYTARSQHLRNVRLSGMNSGEIFAAPFDTILHGNDANNNLKGRAGFDTLYGGLGFDTAVFSGPQADYNIQMLADRIIVEDVLGGHEHTDTLFGIERLQFSDGGFNL